MLTLHAPTVSAPQPARRSWPSLRTLITLARSRAQLATLDAQALRDVGITPAQAHAEATRAAWDVPAQWLR